MEVDEVAHYEPLHQDLRCLQIQLFSSLEFKELMRMGITHVRTNLHMRRLVNLQCQFAIYKGGLATPYARFTLVN